MSAQMRGPETSMAVNLTPNGIASQGLPLQADRPESDRRDILRLAQEFEAMLMTQMLREMRRSMLDDEEAEPGFGAGALTDTADVEFGRAMSQVGGVGLTEALLRAFEAQVQPPKPSAAADAGGAAGAPGAAAPDVTPDAPVSSRFGWRQDPLTGAARFHNGIDIAVAYGQEVKAAAQGAVAFAGVQNGYGHTVVIDHADGRQTRYAHLSEALVAAGATVAAGQTIGRSGSSGRSTGPHLHFEVRVNGQPVNPAAAEL